jgi:hypothetical protein
MLGLLLKADFLLRQMATSWVTFYKSNKLFFSFLLKRAVPKRGLLAAFLSV